MEMEYKIGILLFGLIVFWSCDGKVSTKKIKKEKIEFNQELANELKKMYEIDQMAANMPQGKYKELTREKWELFKDSVFTTNQSRIKEIFDKHGFAGYDLVGKEGSMNFWVIVQHSDHNPNFQNKVLEKMKIEMERNNADPSNFALLTDRVNENLKGKQIYGTQLSYHPTTGQAYVKNLEDSITVNERRIKMGLEPLEDYLNWMTQAHFEMNKKHYIEKGITEPKLYEIKK